MKSSSESRWLLQSETLERAHAVAGENILSILQETPASEHSRLYHNVPLRPHYVLQRAQSARGSETREMNENHP